MKRTLLTGWLVIGLVGSGLADSAKVPDAVASIIKKDRKEEEHGHFKAAAALLQKAIASHKYTGEAEEALEFDLDRLHRIQMDYADTREDLYQAVNSYVKNVSPEEFDSWLKKGWFDNRIIDGKQYYFVTGARNLFFIHPELNARRVKPEDNKPKEDLYIATVEAIKKASAEEKSPYVLPKTMRVDMEVSAHSNIAPAGETISTWIPIPRDNGFQSNFKLLSASSAPKNIAPADSPIRSLFMQETVESNKPTDFKVEYEFTIKGVHFDLKPEDIKPYDTNSAEYKKFTSEGPHVEFTPALKSLSAKIVGNETNSMLKAKKIFDYLSDKLRYSYSTEYCTIPNISDYTLSHSYGDCGQQAFLFIALCRYNGIPARWQTGWNLFPMDKGIHDWAEINLAPYGWMPVDQYMGNYAIHYTTTLTDAQKKELRDFYFGGLDQYRMIANSDHSQKLEPEKKGLRSDDVDFQRGELEAGDKGLYFNDYSYKLNYKIISEENLP